MKKNIMEFIDIVASISCMAYWAVVMYNVLFDGWRVCICNMGDALVLVSFGLFSMTAPFRVYWSVREMTERRLVKAITSVEMNIEDIEA